MAEPSAFELLHEGVRRQLWKMGWPELRPLQVAAIRQILSGTGHAVLSAGTASGKTEAAFLPILSIIADQSHGSVRAIYIGPLKALINDQFHRLEQLCEYLDVPVHRWHGDIDAGAKSKLIEQPGGVLLITPESLESLFVNRSRALSKLFHGLRFAVIDELHSFLDNERGRHLRSLLYRLGSVTERPVRMVGLSATIGEPMIAKRYIDRHWPEDVAWIEGAAAESELKLRLHAYAGPADDQHSPEDNPDAPPPHLRSMAGDLLAHCRGQTNLIFANARSDVEFFGDLCGRMAKLEGMPDRFLVHHGSLSADIRQETEEVMKRASHNGPPATTFCSSTLEMGIDIGSVRMVGQIGAPHSVASLKQRVGRSGRRQDTPRILRAYLQCKSVDAKSDLFDRLHLPLIQSIAVIELLLSGWVEPAEPSSFDLSTLTQQLISLISQTGGIGAKDAHRILCENGAFYDVDAATFIALLRELSGADVIEQTVEGDLILGLFGEDLRKDKGFYAAFMGGDGVAVLHDGQRIGTVDDAPPVNEHLILAGRRWKVTAVDQRQRAIYVQPASGSKAAPFAGGGWMLHPRIAEEMKKILGSDQCYAYLNPAAKQLLADARHAGGMADLCNARLLSLDARSTALLAWTGSRTLDTLRAMFKARGIDVHTEPIAILLPHSIERSFEILREMRQKPLAEPNLLEHLTGPPAAKYDALLGAELRQRALARRWLDVPSAMAVITAAVGGQGLTDSPGNR